MTAPDGLSRRGVLVKLGMLFNGMVGAILAVPIVRYILSPVIREREARDMNPGSRWARWVNFPKGRRVSRLIEARPRIHRMGKPRTFPAGCVAWTVRSSRCLRSIARIWDVRFAGFHSRVCSCAHAMAASTIPTARAPPDLRSAACLNTATRWSRGIC